MRSQPLRRLLHVSATVVAVAYLVFVLTVAVLSGFSNGVGIGLRSLAAALLPPLVAIYLGFLSGVKFPINRSRSPRINNFVLFTLWTLLIMGLVGIVNPLGFPLLELLYALTLAAMIWRFKQGGAFAALAACAYGILCGGLLFTAIFGWPHGS
ncbi:hypothetical protein C7271_19710 [filamentous cyanobacterium CCP5]|nr:hypothetical protein C7271_19710 [filamentous cyanobacterium CCP5]